MVVTLAEAQTIIDRIGAWVGWEMWDADRTAITLDGEFTPRDLEALVIVLRSKACLARPTSPRKR